MESIFIHWDNSNIFIEAQRLAEQREEAPTPATAYASSLKTCCGWRMPTARLSARRRPARCRLRCASCGIE